MTLQIIWLILLILFTAFTSAFEVAVVAISDAKVENDADHGKKAAKKIMRFTQHIQRHLTNIQVMHMLILFIMSFVFIDILGYLSLGFEAQGIFDILNSILLGSLLFMTYMVVGHMIPRRLAIKWTQNIAYQGIGIMSLMILITSPIARLFDMLSKVITKVLFNMKFNEGTRNVTEEEIRSLVETSGKKGVIDEQESEMIHNIFDFDDTTVDQIMTHRTEISAINVDFDKSALIHFVTNEKYTRFPVYEGDIDHIVGTLHVKELLRYLDKKNEPFNLKQLVRKAYYIPDSKKIRELFYEMKKSKNHIAVVIDEYGGTAGIITIEDLIEEIVGNIFDEYDDVEEEVVMIDENTYEIDGLANIDDIEDIIEAKLPVEDYDTLSGFILGFLGRFPNDDEKIEFRYNNFMFKVLEINDKVISKVLAIRQTEPEDEVENKANSYEN